MNTAPSWPLHPLDASSAQFNLAQAYFAAGQRDKAEEHVLGLAGGGAGLPPRAETTLATSGLYEKVNHGDLSQKYNWINPTQEPD